MQKYKQLSYGQRCQLSAFLKAGYYQKDIAKELGVHPSTISRELCRNTRWNGVYSPEQGDALYTLRRRQSRKPKVLTSEMINRIKEKLQLEWSPEQISGYGKKHQLYSISHECIYQYILSDKRSGGKLYLSLRHGRKRYRKRYGSTKRAGPIKNRVMIDERPDIVDKKSRIGDWEIDTIIGRQHKKAIVTLVERVSKKTLIGQVGTKHSDFVSHQTIALLLPYKFQALTITADNGSEFALHEAISKALELDFYFAHPYHSWERGLNENTNGLIRQYIPKGSDFSNLTETDIRHIENRLNNRPRKSLDYATPNEVFEQHCGSAG